MAVHKDCYSAIDLTQQDGPHRRETLAPTGAGDIMHASPEDNAQLLCANIGGMG